MLTGDRRRGSSAAADPRKCKVAYDWRNLAEWLWGFSRSKLGERFSSATVEG